MFKTLFAASLLAISVTAAMAEPFTIVTLGDTAYGKPEEVYPKYEALIGAINAKKPDLVIHVGDTKSGSTPCSDEALDKQLSYLNSFAGPLLYSIGDNEWTDCHREKAGKFDPIERLARIRTTYFADGTKSIVATTLKSLESRFVPFDFFRTHKSYLVNLRCVHHFLEGEKSIQMTDSQQVTVSRRKLLRLKEQLSFI